MSTVKFTKESKEFKIMQDFYKIMKDFGSIDENERWADYNSAADAFINADADETYKQFRTALIRSWTDKLKKDHEQKLLVMNTFFKKMGEFGKMESDEDWEKAVDSFGEFSQLNPNWIRFSSDITYAWMNKLSDDYYAAPVKFN